MKAWHAVSVPAGSEASQINNSALHLDMGPIHRGYGGKFTDSIIIHNPVCRARAKQKKPRTRRGFILTVVIVVLSDFLSAAD